MMRPATALAILLLGSCGGNGGGALKQKILHDLTFVVVLPGYRDFAASAAELRRAAEAFRAEPSPENLEAVRKAWAAARRAWNLCQAHLVGPEADRLLDAKIDHFPVSPSRIEEVVRGSEPIDADRVELLGANRKGLGAIEVLLFEGEGASRRRDLVAAMAGNLQKVAEEIRDLWEPGRGGFDPALAAGSRDAAFDLVINRMIFFAESTADLYLRTPPGDHADSPRPQRSVRSLEDVRERLRGLRNLYEGRPGGAGLAALVEKAGPELDRAIRAAFDQAEADVAAIPGSLAGDLKRAPAEVQKAFGSIKELKMRLATDLVSVYRTTLRISPFDGD